MYTTLCVLTMKEQLRNTLPYAPPQALITHHELAGLTVVDGDCSGFGVDTHAEAAGSDGDAALAPLVLSIERLHCSIPRVIVCRCLHVSQSGRQAQRR